MTLSQLGRGSLALSATGPLFLGVGGATVEPHRRNLVECRRPLEGQIAVETARARSNVVLMLWAALMCCVIIGSLQPATSPVMGLVGRMHVSDKALHFCAYLVLALLPVIGFRDRNRGIVVGLSMFILSLLLEGAQHFAPGRAVEFHDVVANGAGVSCGTLLGLPVRAAIAFL